MTRALLIGGTGQIGRAAAPALERDGFEVTLASRSGASIDAPMIMIARFRDGRMCWGWGSYDLAAAERIAEAIARGEAVET